MTSYSRTRAQFGLIGIAMLATLPFLLLVGRVTDRIGVRLVTLTVTLLIPPAAGGMPMLRSGRVRPILGAFLLRLLQT